LKELDLKLVSIPFDQAYGPGFEDMQRRVPDISKVKAKLGWAPSHSLDSIIDSVAENLKK
jgi:UDP-glucose 4-epimerase